MNPSRRSMLIAAPSLLLACLTARAQAHDHSHHHGAMSDAGKDPADHSEHMKMMAHPEFTRSEHNYSIPEASLRDEQGRSVALAQSLGGNRPVIVNFIYTSCTTICPVMTATMLQLQRTLTGRGPMPVFVSISVDPSFDSPDILKAYAARHGADWTFLTGPRPTVLGVLEHFDAWRGTKANHAAVTLMRPAGGKTWTRVEGLASADQLAGIWKHLRA